MILVTGATGFVGQRVVKALISSNYSVRAFVHSRAAESVFPRDGVEVIRGDLLDEESLRRANQGVEAVFHLAAVIREGGSQTFYGVNYQGTKNLLKVAEAAGVERFVYASTIGASDTKDLAYLRSRWLAEREVSQSTIPYTILRFSVGFGEGDEFFNVLAAHVRLLPYVPVAGDGKVKFQPISVEDVARCFMAAYRDESTLGKTLDLGGPEYFSYDEMLDLVAETLGVRARKVHLPVSIIKPAVALIEAIGPRPPATLQQLKMLHLDSIAGPRSVKDAFGFEPVSPKGNLGYLSKITLRNALKTCLGFMPAYIRAR